MSLNVDAPKGILQIETSSHYPSLIESYVLLECVEGTSNKFWAAVPDGNEVLTMWGRNGKPPQNSARISRYEAQLKIRSKLKEYSLVKENKLLLAFNEAPEWFEKVKGSSLFMDTIHAKIASKSLEFCLPKATAAKTKFKI